VIWCAINVRMTVLDMANKEKRAQTERREEKAGAAQSVKRCFRLRYLHSGNMSPARQYAAANNGGDIMTGIRFCVAAPNLA